MKISNRVPLSIVLCGLLVIAGCGGGGGGSDGGGSGSGSNPPPPSTGGQNGGGSGGTVNRAPTIEGQPTPDVQPSQSYSFHPSANDPEGDALTFSASNLPEWLSLAASTGRLTGTPTAADVGTYSDIVISVSDGRSSASLPAFSITVTEISTGNATLSWTPPTQNEDGSPLTNLAGYQIRYGQDPDALTTTVSIDNPSLSVYVVDNLSSGTWYFAVAAVISTGVASDLSNIASKTIS